MKIIHLINDSNSERGGAQKLLSNLLNEESEVLSCSNFSKFLSAKLKRLLWPCGVFFSTLMRRPAIVIIHSRCFLPMTFLFRILQIKTVFYAHANYQKKNVLFKLFRCDAYIAVSHCVYRLLIDNKVKNTEVTLLRNPILSMEDVRTNYSYKEGLVRLAFVGSLEPWKGIVKLISLLEMFVKRNNLEVDLTIVGDGSLRKKIEMEASNNNLININVIGYSSNPFRSVNHISTVIIPSLEEGFGMVAIEAIFHSKYVIYNSIPALIEVCANDNYCQPFNLQDYESLERLLLTSNSYITKLSDASLMNFRKSYISETFGLALFLSEYKSFINNFYKEKGV